MLYFCMVVGSTPAMLCTCDNLSQCDLVSMAQHFSDFSPAPLIVTFLFLRISLLCSLDWPELSKYWDFWHIHLGSLDSWTTIVCVFLSAETCLTIQAAGTEFEKTVWRHGEVGHGDSCLSFQPGGGGWSGPPGLHCECSASLGYSDLKIQFLGVTGQTCLMCVPVCA